MNFWDAKNIWGTGNTGEYTEPDCEYIVLRIKWFKFWVVFKWCLTVYYLAKSVLNMLFAKDKSHIPFDKNIVL